MTARLTATRERRDPGPSRLPAIMPTVVASGAKTVVDHFGYSDVRLGLACPTFQTVLRAIDNGRTWVKLSAGYRMGREAMAPCEAQSCGKSSSSQTQGSEITSLNN